MSIESIIRFLKKVCQLLIFIAVPKQPQSGTRLSRASKYVVIVKNIMSSEAPSVARRGKRFNIRQIPTMNSAIIIVMARGSAKSLSHWISYAMK